MEMEQLTIYKKDVERWKSGVIRSRKTFATYLTGSKKDHKVNLRSMCDIKIEDLVGKKFFAAIKDINGTKYIIKCVVKWGEDKKWKMK